jgi:hypothetical protein
MPNTGNGRLDAAVSDVATAFAEWIGSVEAVRAEIRAEIAAAGGDPDGPEATARVRDVVAAARAELPDQSRDAYDWLFGGLRDHQDRLMRGRDVAVSLGDW